MLTEQVKICTSKTGKGLASIWFKCCQYRGEYALGYELLLSDKED
jgi:hypothetical protein